MKWALLIWSLCSLWTSAFAQTQDLVEYCPTTLELKYHQASGAFAEARPLNISELNTLIKVTPPGGDPELYASISTGFAFTVLVNEKGIVEQYCISKPNANRYMMQSVVDQLHILRFEPGTMEGTPVCSWITIPFTVCLRDTRR